MAFTNKIKKKLRPYLAVAGLVLSLASGCKEYRTERSEPKYEDAIVTRMQHRSAYITLCRVGRHSTVITTHPSKNEIDFEVKTAKISANNADIYSRFKVNNTAEVSYVEIYRSVWDDTNKDGKKELLERKLTGYELIDAKPKIQLENN